MNKKNLIILAVCLAVVLVAGFFIYKYSTAVKTENPPDNSGNQENLPQVELQEGGITAEGTNGGGSLSVCLDKCGDGVCQPAGTVCSDNLNCPCAETKNDCPQDCKN